MFEKNEMGFAIGGRARKFQAVIEGDNLNLARMLARDISNEVKAHAAQLWNSGMALLKSIHAEEEKQLEKIWDAPDADEFAKKIAPKDLEAQANEELAEAAKPAIKRVKPALPTGLDLDALSNEIVDTAKAAEVLGVDVSEVAKAAKAAV